MVIKQIAEIAHSCMVLKNKQSPNPYHVNTVKLGHVLYIVIHTPSLYDAGWVTINFVLNMF